MHIYWNLTLTNAEMAKFFKQHSKYKTKKKETNHVVIDIKDYIETIEWSGASTEASRTLVLTMANNPNDDNFDAPELKSGDIITFYNDKNKRKFYGKVTAKEKSGDIGSIQYTCQDLMNNVLKSNVSKKYKGKSPEYIAKDACKIAGIKTGSLVKTYYKVSKLYASDTPIYNIIMKAFHKATQSNGIKYFPYMDGDRFCVKRKGELVKKKVTKNGKTSIVEYDYILDQAQNITSAKYTESIDDMVNTVVIYKENGKKIGTVKKKDWINTFGTYQATVQTNKGNGRKVAKAALKGKTKTMSIEAIGNEDCISGAGIKIYDKASGLVGLFWIESDTHTWENGNHKMSLELTLKNVTENPDVSYDSGSSSSDGETYVSTDILNGKKRKNLRFTAYSIGEGGVLDSNSRALKYGEHTIAADFLKYGTKIQIFGTGTKWDKKVMTVRDNGLGNNYTLDILMPKKEENKWNNPHGYIIISDGTGFKKKKVNSSGGSLSKKQKKVLEWCEKYLYKNCHHMYGDSWGIRPPWDCSAFTKSVYKHLGITLGSTTYQQVHNGKSVAKKAGSIQAGDIILWNNSSGRPGHVGLIAKVVGNKYLLYQNSPNKGVHKAYVSFHNLMTNCEGASCNQIRRIL